MKSLQRMFILKPIEPDLVFSVLRRRFSAIDNDLVEFVRGKLHPVAAPVSESAPERVWRPTAVRHEVLLPAMAPDLLSDPRRLTEAFEDQPDTNKTDLAVVVKLTFRSESLTMHACWEAARCFARQAFVIEHELPTILVMHAPVLSGMRDATPLHCHVIAVAKPWAGNVFGEPCTIANDAAHEPLAEIWSGMRPA